MKKVLFVCMSNVRRSKMAAVIFEKLSGFKAENAGVDPADEIDKNIVVALKEIGIELSKTKPKKVTGHMLEEADKIITFRCDDKIPQKYKSKIENWELGSKRNIGERQIERTLEDIRNMRDLIYEKVKVLVKEPNR